MTLRSLLLYLEHVRENLFRFQGDLVGNFEAIVVVDDCVANTAMTAFSFVDGTVEHAALGLQVESTFSETYRGYARIIFTVCCPDRICGRMICPEGTKTFLPIQLSVQQVTEVTDFNQVTHHNLAVMMEHSKNPALPRKSVAIVGLCTRSSGVGDIDPLGFDWREVDYHMLRDKMEARRSAFTTPSLSSESRGLETGENCCGGGGSETGGNRCGGGASTEVGAERPVPSLEEVRKEARSPNPKESVAEKEGTIKE